MAKEQKIGDCFWRKATFIETNRGLRAVVICLGLFYGGRFCCLDPCSWIIQNITRNGISHTFSHPLEHLLHVVLDRICDYLDDESDNRSDLWAFSLTSRRCTTRHRYDHGCGRGRDYGHDYGYHTQELLLFCTMAQLTLALCQRCK